MPWIFELKLEKPDTVRPRRIRSLFIEGGLSYVLAHIADIGCACRRGDFHGNQLERIHNTDNAVSDFCQSGGPARTSSARIDCRAHALVPGLRGLFAIVRAY